MKNYTVQQLEKTTGISTHTLRYFDKIGLLCPQRQKNGYRIYTSEQLPIAEMIVSLQKAMFTNREIKQLLDDYPGDATLNRLKENKKKLRREIAHLKRVYQTLGNHIQHLQALKSIRHDLFRPFIEEQEDVLVGLIHSDSNNIVDLFTTGNRIIGHPAWPHHHHHGLLIPTDTILSEGYPVQTMYAEEPTLIRHAPYTRKSGRYLCMYANGNMENNAQLYPFIQHALQFVPSLPQETFIQQISAPVMKKYKQDFLVKLMIRIDLS
ncbi:MerR family transcriptional regulator [Vibrio mangrovi]|uniref:MerR family transcriptional regulator n=1 Tax=Vibrio mangrovi TaxID=474394 RepID=A0A1Y6IRZ9_9VIBR|nr:MerR family transcriptional regulator [Vibrio mangrovi]MDW6003638.1 MerR family transcriptional regulator [Vibrio mangrovi]SMR99570.1 zinc-responsive transcriptional regulator [Vibrio mangrovi]